jgi:hypothetical protein
MRPAVVVSKQCCPELKQKTESYFLDVRTDEEQGEGADPSATLLAAPRVLAYGTRVSEYYLHAGSLIQYSLHAGSLIQQLTSTK